MIKLALLLTFIMSSAYGANLCKDHVTHGELKILKICAQIGDDGVLRNPRLIAKNGIDWPIAPGLTPEIRAKKICKRLGFSSVSTFEVRQCSSEQATVNLRGNYALDGAVWSFACLDKINCL
jgi:hypothetical protein